MAELRAPNYARRRVPDTEILYLDGEIVVVNKPSGAVVHRGWARDRDAMLQRVRDAVGRHVYPVHRLDRGTSGALVFALSPEVAAEVSRAFTSGNVEKCYLALVRGHPPDSVDVDHALTDERGQRVEARTRFARVASSTVERCSLVEAFPETGRVHQIRRHLKHLSHPIVGDVRYGRGDINRHYRATYGLCRLSLHAKSVTLPHPVTGVQLRVEAPLPDDLAGPLRALGLLP